MASLDISLAWKEPLMLDQGKLSLKLTCNYFAEAKIDAILVQFCADVADANIYDLQKKPLLLGAEKLAGPFEISPKQALTKQLEMPFRLPPFKEQAFFSKTGKWGKKVKTFHQIVAQGQFQYFFRVLVLLEKDYQLAYFPTKIV